VRSIYWVLGVAAAIAKALDTSLDYLGLLVDDATPANKRDTSPTYFSEEADEVAQLVDKMPPERRVIALNMTRNLSALPDERQRRQAEARQILDSIERKHGKKMRDDIEDILRRLFRDTDT
jgi:hypothetical protein